MTGNGTQDNPYIPESWTELKQAAETPNAYIQLASNTTWDLANSGVEGIDLICAEIDGNGAVIKRLRLTTSILFHLNTVEHDVVIKNLSIRNAYIKNATVFYCTSSTWVYNNKIQLKNFVFTGGLYNSNLWSCDNQGVATNRCLFSLHLNGGAITLNETEVANTGFEIGGDVSSNIAMAAFNSSEIKGAISGLGQNDLNISGQLCVVDITLDDFGAVSCYGSNPIVLLNTDKIGSATIQGSFIEATSAQMIDASWLNQHGFPCNS